LIERGFFCNLKKSSKQKGKKKGMVVKKGVEKKSLQNAAESGEELVKLPYLRIRENIEINGENGYLLSEKRDYSGREQQIFHYQTVHMLDEHVQRKKHQNRSPCFLLFLLAACR